MSGYLVGIFVICAISGVLGLLTYGDGASEKLVIGIITLYVIISPLSDVISNFDVEKLLTPDIPDTESQDSEYREVLEEAFCRGIALAVGNKFHIDEGNIEVRAEKFDARGMRAEKIKVILSGRAAFSDSFAIEKYLNEQNFGECDVQIEIG